MKIIQAGYEIIRPNVEDGGAGRDAIYRLIEQAGRTCYKSEDIVRHRIASYAQESTRYCNYGADKFGSEITVIEPCYLVKESKGWEAWYKACKVAEKMYFDMLDFGCLPEQARAVLPLSTKTELVMTANMREWRHFLNLRAAGATGRPHPQMLEVTRPLLDRLKAYMPELFGDIGGDGDGHA